MKSTETQEQHYIYKITNNKPTDKRLYYIGVKSSMNPESDNYYGSSEYLNEAMGKIGVEYFTKEILSTWETREEANLEEVRLHWEIDVANSEEFYNKANATSTGFCTKGMVVVKDTRTDSIDWISKEDFEKFDYFTGNSFGLVQALDSRDNKIKRVDKEDFSNNRKFYTTQFDNIIFVKDTRDNKTKQVSKEDFDNYDYYVGATKGQVAVRDTRDNSTKNVSKEDFDKFDYYQAFCKGKVNVIDTRDNKTKQVTKEDFDKFEYYQSVLIGQVTVLDTRDGKKKNVSKEDYNKFSFYQSLMRNRITAIDTRTGINVSISKEDFDNNEYYISSRSKKINIYDSKGVLQFETWGNFKKVCERENLPAFALAESNRHNGKPIPLSNSKKGKTRLISSGFEKQIGWFAKEIEK